MTKIAIVDSKRENLTDIRKLLLAEGIDVEFFGDGQSALDGFHRRAPDLVVINLPISKIDGFSLMGHIRETSVIPIVLLSSEKTEIDEILGLRFGANDYIHLPLSPRLLLERFKGLLNRHARVVAHIQSPKEHEEDIVCGDLVMNPGRHGVSWKNERVRLTAMEFKILYALARRPGMVKTRDQLLGDITTNETYEDERSVDSHVKRVRKKFRTIDDTFSSLETMYGLGYTFTPPSEAVPVAVSLNHPLAFRKVA